MKCIALEFTCLINRYFSVLIIGYLAHLASESETTLTLNAYPVNTITAQSTLITRCQSECLRCARRQNLSKKRLSAKLVLAGYQIRG